jgi:hypothetical protein
MYYVLLKVGMTPITVTGLGLWCLTSLSIVSQLYRGSQFYWRRKLEYLEKTTDLSQVKNYSSFIETQIANNNNLIITVHLFIYY